MKKLLLIFILIGIFIQATTVNAISPLHVEGKYIKNETGHIVYLRGINKHGFEDHPSGHWQRPDGGVSFNTWNPVIVGANLDAMKDWGINLIRSYSTIRFWKENVGDHREIVKEYATLAADRDTYLMYSFWHVNDLTGFSPRPLLPYPPFSRSGDEAVIADTDEFVALWADVANELKGYPNVIFELYNEPVCPIPPPEGYTFESARDEWFNVTQQCINAIRATGATNLIIVQWDWGIWANLVGGGGHFMDWVENYPLNDPLGNIIYSTHVYRDVCQNEAGYCWEYDDLKAGFQQAKVDYVLNTLNKSVNIGEIGPNMWHTGEELIQELAFYNNSLTIFNEWEMGYVAFWWWPAGKFPHLTSDPNYQPNIAGQILRDAINVTPTPPEYPVNITGVVKDSNTSLPIQGATVTCNAYSSTTNSTGGYKIMMPSTGSCNLTASKSGYTPNSTSLSFPSNGTYTQDFTLTPIPLPSGVNVSGRLKDKNNNPLSANINLYEEGTSNVIANNQTSNGYYNLFVSPDVYDIQYNILNFFIPNFFVKLLSLDISSSLSNIINYVTNIGDRNVSFTADISNNQLIQTYSSQRPARILINGTVIPSVSSYSQLTDNTWFYDSAKNRLYVLANVSIPVDTCSDGTLYGECSATKPKYCDEGNLINKCSLCGCPSGQACNTTSETCYTLPPGANRTFGKTDVGESVVTLNPDYIYSCRYTLPEDGKVSQINWYGRNKGTGADNFTIGIFDTSGNLKLQAEEVEVPNSAIWEWHSFGVSPPVELTAGTYDIAIWSEDNIYTVSYSSGETNQFKYNTSETYPVGGLFPDPLELNDWKDWNISFYANYTSC